MKKNSALIFVLITVVIAGAYFYSSRKEIKAQSTDIGAQTNESDNAERKIIPDEAKPPLKAIAFEHGNALSLLSKSKNASDIMPIIWPLAQQGNADAIIATFEIMSRCGQFYGEDRFKPKNTSEPTSPAYALRETAIKRNAAYCNDPNTHKIATAERIVLQDQLKVAALKGDEIALAYEIALNDPNPESATTARRLAKESKEPWVIERALIAMSLNTDEKAQSIDAKIFSSAIDTPEQKLKIKQYAAKWKACSTGASFVCAPNNEFQDNLCMHEGNCYSHLNTKDFIKQRVLSQSEFEKMLQYLKSIDQ